MNIRFLCTTLSFLMHSYCFSIIEEVSRSELVRLLPLLKKVSRFPYVSFSQVHDNINTEGSRARFIARLIRGTQQTYYYVQTPEDARIITQDLTSDPDDERSRVDWFYVLKEHANPRPPEIYF